MSALTADEQAFLAKLEERRRKHKESQARYRAKIGKEAISEYNAKYRAQEKAKLETIQKKVAVPTPINVEQLAQPAPKPNRRTRNGKKAAEVQANVIKASYKKRTKALEPKTIELYMSKADMMQRIFTGKSLTAPVKAELKKLLNDNPNLDEKLILGEMQYLNNNIAPTITKLREKYPNDNTLKSYLIALSVISSHLKSLDPNVHQTLSKGAIQINEAVKAQRNKNELDESEEDKIIDLSPKKIQESLKKLTNIEDKLLFGMFTLFPARRLEYRFLKYTTIDDTEDLTKNDNYLVMSKPKVFVFNTYKTKSTYGQQIFTIKSTALSNLFDQYIKEKKIKPNEYLFGLQRDRREAQEESQFSKKVSDVFEKVYDVPISVRYLRMSHVAHLNNSTPRPSGEEKDELARYMAHSRDEQGLYDKIKRR